MKKGLKVTLIIIPILVLIIMVTSIVYSITTVKVKIYNDKEYVVKEGESIHTYIGDLKIIDINKEKIKVEINGDTETCDYNKKYQFPEKRNYSTHEPNVVYSVAMALHVTFERVNIYKPVVIAGGIIILICIITYIIKTKKPKGEKENGRND